MTAPRFLTLSDVADELQVSLGRGRALVRRGELPAIQIGGRNQWRIERTRFEEYIEISGYKLRSTFFHLEGVRIPSFMGEITLNIKGPAQLVNLAHMLVFFGTYTDSQVVYRPDGWYLIVFKPDGDNSSYNANYYVFKSLKDYIFNSFLILFTKINF